MIIEEQPLYTTAQVARIASVSLRQLQWWDERNVVSPRQDGHSRVYTRNEVFAVMLFAELRARKYSLQKLRRVWGDVRRQGFTYPDAQNQYFATEGKRAHFFAGRDQVFDFMSKRPNARCSLIDLTDLAHRFANFADVLAVPRKRPVREFSARHYVSSLVRRQA